MSFNESEINRATDGKFSEKEGTPPEDGFAKELADTLWSIRERDAREGVCGVDYDHTETTTYEDDELVQWKCEECGAEGEVDLTEEPGDLLSGKTMDDLMGRTADEPGALNGFRLDDLIIYEDGEDGDDEDDDFDITRKFSYQRSYPGMSGIPATSTKHCAECGDEMRVNAEGVSNHIAADGGIDYDKDAQHAAIDDAAYGDADESNVLFVTDDGFEVQRATDEGSYAVYAADGTFLTNVTSASEDHLSIEDEVRERLAELKAASGQ
jgi:hypothetical protein